MKRGDGIVNFGNKLKQLKYENLWAFIRSDVHAVRAGIKLKGQPPLNNPRVFRQAEIIFLGLTKPRSPRSALSLKD